MKKKKEFIVREIVGETILVPVGETVNTFNGLITMNGIGRFIWDSIEKVDSKEELVDLILANYDIDYDTAKEDSDKFLEKLVNADFIEI